MSEYLCNDIIYLIGKEVENIRLKNMNKKKFNKVIDCLYNLGKTARGEKGPINIDHSDSFAMWGEITA